MLKEKAAEAAQVESGCNMIGSYALVAGTVYFE
jgi:hypothetical protein